MKRFIMLSVVLRYAIVLMYPSFDPGEIDEHVCNICIMITRDREWKTFDMFYMLFMHTLHRDIIVNH